MSIKFQKETVKTSQSPGPVVSYPAQSEFQKADFQKTNFHKADFQKADFHRGDLHKADFHLAKREVKHEVGQKFLGGKYTNGYLAAYLAQLQSNPLRTKMFTSGILAALQEILASWIAHDRSKHGHYITSRVGKMAAYGTFIAAPLGHVLIKILQKMFAGRKSVTAKVLQILISNLIVSPIQNVVYLASMAVIAGARAPHQVFATIKVGLMPVMKVSWITSPIALAFAQKFLPQEAWVPFFNIIGFIIGTYVNAHVKKRRILALKRKRDHEREMRRADLKDTSRSLDDYPRSRGF